MTALDRARQQYDGASKGRRAAGWRPVEAASARAERTARTQAQVDELLARSLASAVNQVAGGKQSRFGSTAATSPSPQSATANSRIDSAFAATAGGEANAMLDGVVAAIERQSARTQPVQITAPVTTQPSGVQEVRVTNPPPPVLAPVNVTVNVTSNASPSAIGAAAGAAVSQAQRNTYSDE